MGLYRESERERERVGINSKLAQNIDGWALACGVDRGTGREGGKGAGTIEQH